MYYVFFIQSSVDAHLGCLHVLAIMNSAALNMRTHVYFELQLRLDFWPGMGLLDHILVFSGTSMLLSIVAAPIYIPINSVRGFPFLYSLSSISH